MRIAIVGALIAAMVTVVGAPPAGATVKQRRSGPFMYVTGSDPAPAGDFTETATCPPGFKLTGGGAGLGIAVTDPDDNSRITTSFNNTTTSFRAGGLNDLAAGSHASIATAVCIKSTAPVVLDYFPNSGGAINDQPFRVSSGCQKAIGGGLDMGTPTSEEFLTASFPSSTSSWFVEGINESTTRAVEDTLICLTQGRMKVRYVSRTVIVPPSRTRRVTAPCPGGFRVASGGFASGEFSHVLSSLPFDGADADRAPDDGWKVSVRNEEADPQAATAYAICMR